MKVNKYKFQLLTTYILLKLWVHFIPHFRSIKADIYGPAEKKLVLLSANGVQIGSLCKLALQLEANFKARLSLTIPSSADLLSQGK